MSSADINDKIASIHDQTLSTLRALGLPALPHHYKKHFDQIVRQSEDSELIALQNDDFVSSEELTRYLDIAHRSIEAFVETHADISHVAQLQETYISKTPKEGIERCIQFVDGLSELGHNMSVELKKAQNKIDTLHNELQETITQLTIDPLTKVTNRKGLIDDLHSVIQAGQTKTLPTVLLMIDADDFKHINDHYGHVAGDKVLYFFAHTIKSILRSGDKVYRYGGEEFSVLLNRCNKEKAFTVADKIRSKIEQSHLIYSGQTIKMTVSVGATIHHAGDSYDDFIARADQALYRAKNCLL
ncbi:MAG: GGDEF domain-containing protein [Sulfuricurvum sp. PD_MW2]|uniref:GGDEF domain-containing protein n=1 Tax=Sulfuricurvum sp. PD_MW2 TaxID=2027917 RepID=UPI000C06456F|nr:GGDEF domain-containing protein [Sulfuricurvum sp. PD_MW2]PHM17062.1 MAG: GGDEF domain-containing protein [Sulfuricurvum sp. PD_MW2]